MKKIGCVMTTALITLLLAVPVQAKTYKVKVITQITSVTTSTDTEMEEPESHTYDPVVTDAAYRGSGLLLSVKTGTEKYTFNYKGRKLAGISMYDSSDNSYYSDKVVYTRSGKPSRIKYSNGYSSKIVYKGSRIRSMVGTGFKYSRGRLSKLDFSGDVCPAFKYTSKGYMSGCFYYNTSQNTVSVDVTYNKKTYPTICNEIYECEDSPEYIETVTYTVKYKTIRVKSSYREKVLAQQKALLFGQICNGCYGSHPICPDSMMMTGMPEYFGF